MKSHNQKRHNEHTFANYWMHNGYIQINNEKMSKSLGNFILVHDIIKKHDPNVIRFFMLSVHYRHPINFSDELLENAQNSFDRIRNAYENLQHRKQGSLNIVDDKEWTDKINQHRDNFIKEMNDDFNTANAISVLFELAKDANVYIQNEQTNKEVIDQFLQLFDEITDVLGFSLTTDEQILDEEIEKLIDERNKARKERNFQRADEIRDQLDELGIILEDTPQGTRWKRR